MENLWEKEMPDSPHYENFKDQTLIVFGREKQFKARCHICDEEINDGIVFVHNEGAHDNHCIECLEKIVGMYYDGVVDANLAKQT